MRMGRWTRRESGMTRVEIRGMRSERLEVGGSGLDRELWKMRKMRRSHWRGNVSISSLQRKKEMMECLYPATYPYQIYPSLTPHPNPHHFSNLSQTSSLRPKSPLSAQTYSTSLRAPSSPHLGSSRGLLQPTMSAPLAHNATDVERARAVHGPQCKSIPKLTLSQYPDPVTGKRSMWSQCGDCGAIERSM